MSDIRNGGGTLDRYRVGGAKNLCSVAHPYARHRKERMEYWKKGAILMRSLPNKRGAGVVNVHQKRGFKDNEQDGRHRKGEIGQFLYTTSPFAGWERELNHAYGE